MCLSVGVVVRTGSGASLEQVSKTVNVEPMLVVGSQPGEVSSNVGLRHGIGLLEVDNAFGNFVGLGIHNAYGFVGFLGTSFGSLRTFGVEKKVGTCGQESTAESKA